MGGKERRKLLSEVARQFPRLSEADIDVLLPKDDLILAKLHASKCSVYMVKGDPIFFDCNGKFDLFPSVYALWKVPTMLQCFVIHPLVSPFILGGADLMLPGVLTPRNGFKPQFLSMGQKWAVRVLQCEYPFAVGRTLTSALSIEASGMKGKALQCLHYFSDNLWKNGSKAVPSKCFSSQAICTPPNPCEEPDFATDDMPLSSSFSCEGATTPASTADTSLVGDTSKAASEMEVIKHAQTRALQNAAKSKHREAAGRYKRPTETPGHAATAEDDAWGDGDSDEGPDHSEEEQSPIEGHLGHDSAGNKKVDSCEEMCDAVAPELTVGHSPDSPKPGLPLHAVTEQQPPLQQLSTVQVDFLFQTCLLEALHTSIVDSQLPLDASAVFSKCLLAAPFVLRHPHVLNMLEKDYDLDPTVVVSLLAVMPPAGIVDIQQSSYKKALKFIAWATKEKWIESKEHRGVRTVTRINRKHPRYAEHVVVPESLVKQIQRMKEGQHGGNDAKSAEGKSEQDCRKGPLVFEYYRLLGKARGVLTALGNEGPSPEVYLSKEQAVDVLNSYIKQVLSPESVKAGCVVLDKTLCAALSCKEGQSVDRAEIVKLFLSALDVSHAIVKANSDLSVETPKLVKGKVKPISVSEEVRQGKKFVTVITQQDKYFVDAKMLSELLSRAMAASSSVFEVPVAKGQLKQYGVIVQGKNADGVVTTLMEEFGIQKKHIVVNKR